MPPGSLEQVVVFRMGRSFGQLEAAGTTVAQPAPACD